MEPPVTQDISQTRDRMPRSEGDADVGGRAPAMWDALLSGCGVDHVVRSADARSWTMTHLRQGDAGKGPKPGDLVALRLSDGSHRLRRISALWHPEGDVIKRIVMGSPLPADGWPAVLRIEDHSCADAVRTSGPIEGDMISFHVDGQGEEGGPMTLGALVGIVRVENGGAVPSGRWATVALDGEMGVDRERLSPLDLLAPESLWKHRQASAEAASADPFALTS